MHSPAKAEGAVAAAAHHHRFQIHVRVAFVYFVFRWDCAHCYIIRISYYINVLRSVDGWNEQTQTRTHTFMHHIVFISTEKNQRNGDNVHVNVNVKEYDFGIWDGMRWDETRWYRYSVLSIFRFVSFYVLHRISLSVLFFLLPLFDRCCDVRRTWKPLCHRRFPMSMLYM